MEALGKHNEIQRQLKRSCGWKLLVAINLVRNSLCSSQMEHCREHHWGFPPKSFYKNEFLPFIIWHHVSEAKFIAFFSMIPWNPFSKGNSHMMPCAKLQWVMIVNPTTVYWADLKEHIWIRANCRSFLKPLFAVHYYSCTMRKGRSLRSKQSWRILYIAQRSVLLYLMNFERN